MTQKERIINYLEDNDYEVAVDEYRKNKRNISLPRDYALLLAKALYVTENYEETINVLRLFQEEKNTLDKKIQYQYSLLLFKTLYLTGKNSQHILTEIQQKIIKKQFSQQHLHEIRQIKQVIMHNPALQKSMIGTRQFLFNEGKNFKQLFKKQSSEDLMEAMPVYLIPVRWYEKWEAYVHLRQSNSRPHPGPITQFQILDHLYNIFYDKSAQKSYTNYYLFKTNKFMALSKNCWMFLYERYRGIQVKRWNIQANERTSEIMTQYFLKEIRIAKQANDGFSLQFNTVQITKKQSWKGLIKKIGKQWGQNGTIYRYHNKQLISINQNTILEDADTVAHEYIYSFTNRLQKTGKKESIKPIQQCGQCKKITNLHYCQCRSIKYCGMDCLRADRQKHRKRCELQMAEKKQKAVDLEKFNLSERTFGGRKGLVGLRNLGNTCYMNSGLQCLSNTQQLTEYFLSNNFMRDINRVNPLGTRGNLACAYAELIRQIWTQKDDVVSPFTLKKMIGKFASQFTGFGQQDSQQFIGYLIDGLQEDLNLVKQKQTFDTKDEIVPDEQASRQSQQNYSKRIKSFIRDLMVGQFKSTVVCSTCNKVSVCFDPFMLVTIPIPTQIQAQIYFVHYDPDKPVERYKFNLRKNLTTQELKKTIAEFTSSSQHNLYIKIVDIKTGSFKRQLDQKDEQFTPIYAQNINEHFFCYEIPKEPQSKNLYKLHYFYEKTAVSFPRYVLIDKKCQRQERIKLIAKTYERFVKTSNAAKYIAKQSEVRIQNNVKTIDIYFTEELELLKFIEKRDFALSGDNQKNLYSLDECLASFSQRQKLQKQNEWYCNKCKEFRPATKQMEIYKSNKILVISFKRFNRFRKVKAMIEFPIDGMDFGPYLKSNKNKQKIYYDLYGVVNHYGTLGGGHYTAFCKNFLNNRWYEFNDSRVSQIRPKQVVSDSAYVLFYRLRS